MAVRGQGRRGWLMGAGLVVLRIWLPAEPFRRLGACSAWWLPSSRSRLEGVEGTVAGDLAVAGFLTGAGEFSTSSRLL
jgi:hypothetical protein